MGEYNGIELKIVECNQVMWWVDTRVKLEFFGKIKPILAH